MLYIQFILKMVTLIYHLMNFIQNKRLIGHVYTLKSVLELFLSEEHTHIYVISFRETNSCR